ncbi:MAG TPA: hypothetical protein VEW67_07585 [Thermoleophilaceae bacterium]|nr:hypothetical protein [Thermoleophilaceae bacterium]
MTTPTKLTALVALGRLAFGAGLIVAPSRVAAGWLGEVAERPAAQVAIRGLGARDVALSAGALTALDDNAQLRRWVLAAAACDLADVTIALATPSGALPANARWGTVALGGGAAVAGLLLYVALDR